MDGGEAKKHRHLSQIIEMIEEAHIAECVKRDATAVFRRLGEAEAAVHRAPEEAHLHEVGAVDSIADIVGTCLGGWHLARARAAGRRGSEMLGLQSTGGETVKTKHGLLPTPAPGDRGVLPSLRFGHGVARPGKATRCQWQIPST